MRAKILKKSQIHHFLVMKLLFLINFCLVILGNVSKRLSRKILIEILKKFKHKEEKVHNSG